MRIHKILISGTGRTFVQPLADADIHTQYGRVSAHDLAQAAEGDVVTTDNGESLVVFTPHFIDRYKRIRREAQIITFKDAGIILTTAGLTAHSRVAEAGSGSGALTILLAQHCKEVLSYDINQEHLAVAKENVELFGLDNVTFAHHDIAQGIPAQDLDALILDMPQPWDAFVHIPQALKVGGYIVTYVPSTSQLQHIHHHAVKQGLFHVRTVEVSERHWMVKEQAVRPTSKNVAFTAFLSFFRYLGPNWPALRPQEKQRAPAWTLPDEEAMRAAFD